MAKKALLISSSVQSPNGASGVWNNINNIASAYIKGIQTGNLLIIRKTKCSCHSERSVLFRKTKRT